MSPIQAMPSAMKSFQKCLKYQFPDSLLPAVETNRQILNIGIAYAVTDCPSHPDDILLICGDYKAMAAGNQPGDQVLSGVIPRLPPPLCPVKLDDLPDLSFVRLTKKCASAPYLYCWLS